jgi:hypothetical protein
LFGNGTGFVWYGGDGDGTEEEHIMEGAPIVELKAGLVAVHTKRQAIGGLEPNQTMVHDGLETLGRFIAHDEMAGDGWWHFEKNFACPARWPDHGKNAPD